MRFRKLRIAWSVFWGLAFVLLIVLWVRSYWYLNRVGSGTKAITSMNGCLVKNEVFNLNQSAVKSGETVSHYHLGGLSIWNAKIGTLDGVGIGKSIASYRTIVAVVAVVGAVVWVPRRFSLRTLLIATALVAVLLGLVVWLSRK